MLFAGLESKKKSGLIRQEGRKKPYIHARQSLPNADFLALGGSRDSPSSLCVVAGGTFDNIAARHLGSSQSYIHRCAAHPLRGLLLLRAFSPVENFNALDEARMVRCSSVRLVREPPPLEYIVIFERVCVIV